MPRKYLIILIAILYLWHFPTYKGFDSSNEYSRIYMASALSRGLRLNIDQELTEFGDIIDKSLSHGRHYSDKAPLSSIIIWPATLMSMMGMKARGLDYTRERLLSAVRTIFLIPAAIIFLSIFIKVLRKLD